MISTKDANAMAEVLHYLKGIRQEDIDKIPKKLIKLFEENASKDYICNFDYTKSLNELELLDETRGFISMICLNYWCETEEQKKLYIKKLNENEKKYQDALREKYNPDDIFKNNKVVSKKEETVVENVQEESTSQMIVESEKNIFQKVFDKIKEFINKRK